MKIKNLILKILKQEGLSHVFMVPGGLVDPFLTAFDSRCGITPIIASQEGGAAYMADGYARASRKFGVCLGIGGPGIANMTTGILTAQSDHSPLLIVSGEVPTSIEGLGAFQDASLAGLNDYSFIKPMTAASLTLENPLLFHHQFRSILSAMLGNVKSPVHLCLPTDIQEADVGDDFDPMPSELYYSPILDQTAAEKCLEMLNSTRIAILAGYGTESDECSLLLKQFSEKFSIPVATTLRAKGAFPENHPNALGIFGYAGTRHATEAFMNGDLEVLLVLGSGLNQRDSMYWNHRLNPSKAFIQVNVDLHCIASYPHSLLVQGDCKNFMNYLLKHADLNDTKSERQKWLQTIQARGPRLYDAENMTSNTIPIHPARAIKDLSDTVTPDTTVIVDSGAHRAFSGHYFESNTPNNYISATNLGPMGWAIPAGIGAKLARPNSPCCVITGDGCMLMHGMEVHTAAKYNIPVVFVIINNGALGNVYLRAKKEGPQAAQLASLPDRDWAGFARALGAEAATITDPKDLKEAFEKAFQSQRPYVIDIKCDKDCPTPVEPYQAAQKAWSYHD